MPPNTDPVELLGILLGLVLFLVLGGGFIFWIVVVLRRSWGQQSRVDQSLNRTDVH